MWGTGGRAGGCRVRENLRMRMRGWAMHVHKPPVDHIIATTPFGSAQSKWRAERQETHVHGQDAMLNTHSDFHNDQSNTT